MCQIRPSRTVIQEMERPKGKPMTTITYKTIVAVLRDLEETNRILPVAIDLAREHDAHLITLHSEPATPILATPDGFASVEAAASERIEAEGRATTLESHVRELCDREGISYEAHDAVFNPGGTAGLAVPIAITADLVIYCQPNEETGTGTAYELEQIIFKSGRPVLIVPTAFDKEADLKVVTVAWNGTRESARAAFDSLPILKMAKSVEVLVVDPESDANQDSGAVGHDIASSLSRHGVNVSVKIVMSGGIPVGETIENRLAETRSGMIVMGAYSKSRLRERLFGGVTRTILGSTPALTLMSH